MLRMRLLPAALLSAALLAAEPLRLHPENPHYFVFNGRPTVLITSGEHYGAVLIASLITFATWILSGRPPESNESVFRILSGSAGENSTAAIR